MDTSLTDDTLVRHPVVLRVLVVAGALFGFTLLALAVSAAADASEGPPPDRPGLLDHVGSTVHGVLKPAEPALTPVTEPVRAVTSQVARVAKPVTNGLEPVLAPVTRPVLHAVEPVLSALRPVTEPVLHAVSPVTSPVLRATAPLTDPVVRAVGAEHVVPAVTGLQESERPAHPAPREDIVSSPSVTAPAGSGTPVTVTSADPQRSRFVHAAVRPAAGHSGSRIGVADPTSGSGGGGLPADVSGASGAMSASPGGQHGGEYAVTTAGSAVPGSDRTWRAPPAGAWSLHWLEYYGNDHPS
ncbi:hypothetical protein Amsp01_104900 [Amycolatopsis sp. NBRC 101858]|uniref:hypothetical protein n=1 Tax=Amycolatopsis sp. NBRC 101858 TaxID=3032200 RepID=UPI0024A08937|nr:hypothetical protein [Amycolatopsis sp. NBRC 101858]GLY44467.1 hypothetical protein Amsp01_104900 [Amycolatopsis sp. NBRC 101858]